MNTPAQDFEADWNRERGKLRSYFLRRGFTSTDVDDRVQEVAVRLWQRYYDQKKPEDVSSYSMRLAENVLYDVYRNKKDALYNYYRDELRSRFQLEPPEYFEKQTMPFADLWGRAVPSNRWDHAEEFSLAPFREAELIDKLESLAPKDYRIVYYLAQDLPIRKISELMEMPLFVLRHRIRRLRELYRQESWPTTRKYRYRKIEPSALPPWFALPNPDLISYLRKLPGYVPEWNLWFTRLSDYTTANTDPITFGVIERIARATRTLSEDHGKRFLLAATTNRGGLLTQKFFQIVPHGEPRSLSLSDIAQLLRHQSFPADTGWMDQIATAWEPTPKWRELTAWL